MRVLLCILSAWLFVVCLHSPVLGQFNYKTWSNSNNLSLVGSAINKTEFLRLTPSARKQKGAVWYNTKQKIENFETIFSYMVSEPGGLGGTYADGITFVVQNYGPYALGGNGGAIGYGGIANSLVVEFDNFRNSEYRDCSNNHVGVQTGGTGVNSQIHKPPYCLDTTSQIPQLASGPHIIKIKYSHKTLFIYIDDMAHPILTTAIDIEKTLNLLDGLAWVGFTSATGNAYQNTDLFSWSFDYIKPIVIIPGMATSSLYQSKSDELYESSRLWVNIDRLLSIKDAFFDTLQLAEDGSAPLSTAYEIKVAPLPNDANHTITDELNRLPLSTYKDMIYQMQDSRYGYVLDDFDNNHNEGENLYIFTYDWRQSILSIAGKLSSRIDSILAWAHTKKVRLVAHSMGGLVAKQLIQAYGDSRVSEIAFIATPHLGAPKAAYTLQSGKLFDYCRLIINIGQIKKIMRNFPSAYTLLPSPTYFDWTMNNGVSAKSELYQSYVMNKHGEMIGYDDAMDYWHRLEVEPGIKEFNSALLDSVTEFNNRLYNVDFGSVKLFNIVGFGISTIGMIKNSDFAYHNLPALGLYNLNGDGTVPLRSAEMINYNQRVADVYVYMGDHSDICSYPEVLTRLLDWLEDPYNYIVDANNRVFPYPPASYSSSGFFVRVGCPVSLQVSDQSNNYIGANSGVTWTTQIPGSYFYATSLTDPQADKIISLPLNQPYKIIVKSQDTSAHFDLEINKLVNGDVTNFIRYDSVLTSKYTEASMDFEDIKLDLLLNINNGDSTPLLQIKPTHIQEKFELTSGWNLLSLGVVPVTNKISQIYPKAISGLFIYNNGQYQAIDSVPQRLGCWIKFDTTFAAPIYGATKYRDTVSVSAGWNIIGSLSVPCFMDSTITDPPNLIDGLAYEFTAKVGYKRVSILQPGRGYWIKTNSSGKLILR